ncbi:unnamed protein product [Caenorhabditis auriculariae]|uniref:CUB-like domain-containing protein n=1 Tax=Caenorhabditis auriculariae TaxID=2777116 RepID=A0A8S1HB61_9PELO|nr:unnamed protein product [Caenorhabditis auriculariae]
MFQTYVNPVLEYCSELFSPAISSEESHKLESSLRLFNCPPEAIFLNDGEKYTIVPTNCTYQFIASNFLYSTVSAFPTYTDCQSCFFLTYNGYNGRKDYNFQSTGLNPVPPVAFNLTLLVLKTDFNITISTNTGLSSYVSNRTMLVFSQYSTIIRASDIPTFSLLTIQGGEENMILRSLSDPSSGSNTDDTWGVYIFAGDQYLCTAADISRAPNRIIMSPTKQMSFLTMKNVLELNIRTVILVQTSAFGWPVALNNVILASEPTYNSQIIFPVLKTVSVTYLVGYNLDSSEAVISDAVFGNISTNSTVDIYAGCLTSPISGNLIASIDPTNPKKGMPIPFRGPCKTIIVPGGTNVTLINTPTQFLSRNISIEDGGQGILMSRTFPYQDTFLPANNQTFFISTPGLTEDGNVTSSLTLYVQWGLNLTLSPCLNFSVDDAAFQSTSTAVQDILGCPANPIILSDGDTYNLVPTQCNYTFLPGSFIFTTFTCKNYNDDQTTFYLSYNSYVRTESFNFVSRSLNPIPPIIFNLRLTPRRTNYNFTITAKSDALLEGKGRWCSFVGASVGVTSPLEPEKAVGRDDEGREDGEDGGGRHLPMDSAGKKAPLMDPTYKTGLLPSRIHRKMSSSTVLTVFAALVASANGLLWLQWGALSPYLANKTVTSDPNYSTLIRGSDIFPNTVYTVQSTVDAPTLRVITDPYGHSNNDDAWGIYVFFGSQYLCTAAEAYFNLQHSITSPGRTFSFLTLKNLATVNIRTDLLVQTRRFGWNVQPADVYPNPQPTYESQILFMAPNSTTLYYYVGYDKYATETAITNIQIVKKNSVSSNATVDIYAGCLTVPLAQNLIASVSPSNPLNYLPIPIRGNCKTFVVPAGINITFENSPTNLQSTSYNVYNGKQGILMSRTFPFPDTFGNINLLNVTLAANQTSTLTFNFQWGQNTSSSSPNCVNIAADGGQAQIYCSANSTASKTFSIKGRNFKVTDNILPTSGGYLMKYSVQSSLTGSSSYILGLLSAIFFMLWR